MLDTGLIRGAVYERGLRPLSKNQNPLLLGEGRACPVLDTGVRSLIGLKNSYFRRSKMTEYEQLFKFAAKAGALEGYLYDRQKVEPLYNWVANIEKMYAGLPDEIKKDVKDEFSRVLTRTLTHGADILDAELKTRLNKMLLLLKIW